MRSIRLSLLLYFLVLLAAGLGAVSVLAYHYTERVLQAKETTRAELLQNRYEERVQDENDRLDAALKEQARSLAELTRLQIEESRPRRAVAPLGLLSASQGSRNLLSMLFWLGERMGGPHGGYLHVLFGMKAQFNELKLPHHNDVQVAEYFQINNASGVVLHSPSLGERSFPFDLGTFNTTPLLEPRWDNIELSPGLRVRRVTLKAPLAGFVVTPPPEDVQRYERERRERRDRPERVRPRSTRPSEHPQPAIYIQCAAETSQLDQKLAALAEQHQIDLSELRAESISTLATFRNRLILIGLGTFAATLLGGFVLVRFGLSPLRRLTDAVSRVSEKDFRLPLEDRHMPGELRPIVNRLEQTLDLLKRAFAREKQAAADISHELRTPLAALLTTIEVGLRKQRSPEEYRELLQDCHATGQQMSQLVERLLALARLDAGVDTLRPQTVDAAELAAQCADLVHPLAQARDVVLRVHRNGPCPINADPNKLREIFTNLLHNAIEYNRPHGSIDLSVARQDGTLSVEVRDTGIGIAPDARQHIFERFYRADPARQDTGLHAGLGLAIVKGYVDLMGGNISVDSTEGVGSVFRLEMPVKPA
jgi:two-component system, OmpR family, heavy metal sensor histidine kinase CusS